MQDSMNIKWPEKGDEIYYLVENIASKIEPPVSTRDGLHDCFMMPKQMITYYIISTDFIILYGCSLTFEKLET